MTAYYEGNPTPHTLYYYGTGTAGVSEMNPLPANSIAYVKPGQTGQKQPTAELLANVNVVGPDSVARSLVIDGDKPFFIPTEFTAENISFTKSGEGYQALRLPFNTWAGLGIVREDGTVDNAPETFAAGEPVLFKDAVSISEPSSGDALTHETFGRLVHEGTFAETESGYIFDGSSFVLAENISPFTFIWDDPNGVQDLKEDFKNQKDQKDLNNTIYNMAGQRVGKPSKGLYIKGGRKVLIKEAGEA